jgi:hypothetical protein
LKTIIAGKPYTSLEEPDVRLAAREDPRSFLRGNFPLDISFWFGKNTASKNAVGKNYGGGSMRITSKGQVTIPQNVREQMGFLTNTANNWGQPLIFGSS